jgi:hypothetical protein
VRPDVLPILPGPNVSSGSIAEVHGHVDRRQHAVERAVELSRRRRRSENRNKRKLGYFCRLGKLLMVKQLLLLI